MSLGRAHDAPVRRNHAQEDPIEGFDVNDLPPMGPDGLAVPPQRAQVDPPPRLCEQGPCVHYHRFAIQLDVEAGLREADGSPAKQPFHVRVHHYCYPNSGVETELGALPVLECNRWQPMGSGEMAHEEGMRADYLASPDGQEYTRKLEEWKAARAAEAEGDEDNVATWIAMNLRDGGELIASHTPTGPGPINHWHIEADTARAFVTRDYLKNTYGTGVYELVILPPERAGKEPDPGDVRMQLEVT